MTNRYEKLIAEAESRFNLERHDIKQLFESGLVTVKVGDQRFAMRLIKELYAEIQILEHEMKALRQDFC